jgi:hypothetical protein
MYTQNNNIALVNAPHILIAYFVSVQGHSLHSMRMCKALLVQSVYSFNFITQRLHKDIRLHLDRNDEFGMGLEQHRVSS